MKWNKPQFELARVFSDGTHEPPKIVPITDLPPGMQMDRRSFLGAGIGATAALLLMDGCATAPEKKVSYTKIYDKVTHTWRYYTLPCGSAVPAGAICTCNCVPAAAVPATYTICACQQVCTCDQVCTCVPVSQ